MKIAHVAPPWIPIPPKHYGGTEAVIYNLVEEQVAQGHDVTLFAPGDAKTSAKLVSFFPRALAEEGVPWSAHLKAYYHLHKSLEYAKTEEFDIVHTHLSCSADLYIFPLTASLPIPHVTTLHSAFPFDRVFEREPTWIGDADNYYMEWAPSVPMIAISESSYRQVPYHLNFVGIVHHGLLMQFYQPTGEPREDFFVWLGRFVPEKGAHLAIEAAKHARVPLVLAGIIDPYSQKSVRYFADMVKPLIDNDRVRYIGPVNMQQKISLLSRARGLLNPIEWEEPFGMVMIEAMALGCPVITFARGAAPEIVLDGQTGFLVHALDEMVQAIPRLGQLDRQACRLHVEHHFSARVMAQKYIKIYKEVLLKSKGVAVKEEARTGKGPLVTPAVPSVKALLPIHVPYQSGQVARAQAKAKPGE